MNGEGTGEVEIGGEGLLAGKWDLTFTTTHIRGIEMTPRHWALLKAVQAGRDRKLDDVERRPLKP